MKSFLLQLFAGLIIGLVILILGIYISQSTISEIWNQLLLLKISGACLLILCIIIILSLSFNVFLLIKYFKLKNTYSKNDDKLSDKEIEKIQIDILKNLSSDEKSLLKQYFDNDTRTLDFSLHDGTVMSLKAQGILFMPSQLAKGRHMITSFSIQPWAYEYLLKHQELLK